MEKIIIIECAFCGKEYPIKELATKNINFVNICDECWDDIHCDEDEQR